MTRMPTAPPLDSFLDKGIQSVLVVDFDGVFNCVRYQGRANSDFFEEEVYLADDIGEGADGNEIYTLRWSTELVQEINAIASDPTVQVLWLTTWRENMGDVVRLLELEANNEMYYIPWKNLALSDGKMKSFIDYFNGKASHLKVAWVDDLVFTQEPNVEAIESFNEGLISEGSQPIKHFCPFSIHGIDRQMLKDVKEALN